MKILTVLLLSALLSVANFVGAASSLGPLANPEQVAASLDTLKPLVIDIRGDDYAKGHIPGSISAPYGLFRGPKENPGQLVDVAVLEERFESLGFNQSSPMVIVVQGKTDTDFGAAARVYWTLKSTGFTDLTILNGGLLAWKAAGLPVDTEVVTLQPSALELTFSDQWMASTEQVAAMSRGDVDALLLDARTDDFFQGRKSHPAAARPGTLPGAENLAYTAFFDEGSTAMSAIPDGGNLMANLGIEEGEDVVSFCNTGHWAATNWFALSEVAGIENVKLYPGSMVEYASTDYDMENTPNVIQHFMNKLRGY